MDIPTFRVFFRNLGAFGGPMLQPHLQVVLRKNTQEKLGATTDEELDNPRLDPQNAKPASAKTLYSLNLQPQC